MEETHLKKEFLVSICMPAYNAGEFILEAIDSILKQSYRNWELIIVNDGSTDGTEQLLRTISHPQIKIYHQENNGQCNAANQAFTFSRGDLIKFMDADDLLSQNFIENQVLALKGDIKHTIAYSSWGRFYDNDLNTFKLDKESIINHSQPLEWLIASMSGRRVMLQCGLWLIPREILNKSGLWNEKLSLINDFEFFIRVLLHADKLNYAPESILYYRSGNENSLSKIISEESIGSAYESITSGLKYILDRESSPRVKKIAADCFQDFIYTYYPSRMDLINKAEAQVKQLGGANIEFPSGGYTKIVQNIIGWKTIKRLKRYVSGAKLG